MNPASRLKTLVDFFHSSNSNALIKAEWERYMDSASTPLTEDEVLDVIQAVLAEIRAMETKLRDIGVPISAYLDCINQLRSGFSPTQLGTHWAVHRDQMTKRATPLALEWASWTLSQFDENEIDEEAMGSLRTSLEEQERLLQQSNLPPGLREILERQTAALRRALYLYRIQGVAPLRKAVSDSVGEFQTASPELVAEVESGDPTAKKVLTQGMALIGKVAEVADKGSKTIKFGKEIYEIGTSTWSAFQGLLT